MNISYRNRVDRKNGVALVIVLGLLSVLTTLAVAFAIAMRVEYMAAQNFANSVRAEHIAQAGISHAMEWINRSMITNPLPVTYPRWTNSYGQLTEAVASTGRLGICDSILNGEVEKAVPAGLLPNAQDAMAECHWDTVIDSSGRSNRFAYLVVDMSGLLDANYSGGRERTWSESLREIDIHKVPGIADTNAFFADRQAHVRYETLPELLKLNTGLTPDQARCLYVYSYDSGRDETFRSNAVPPQTGTEVKLSRLGMATTNDLELKFNVNALTNMNPATYTTDTNFLAYKTKLIQLLRDAGRVYKPEDVVWNVVNWIDTDRYPQNEPTGNPAYVSTEGGEALPLINEIVLKRVVTQTSTGCQFCVELWYPFVVENEIWGGTNGSSSVQYSMLIDTRPTNGTLNVDLTPMAYGATNEFMVYTSAVMDQLSADVRVIVFEGAKNDPGRRAVDAAMNRSGQQDPYGTKWSDVVMYTTFSNFYSMEVDDPRSNGKPVYWVMKAQGDTLGTTNSISDPWGDKWPGTFDRQGLPIYVKNGPMENIGEMGYIPLANRENHPQYAGIPVKHYWCTIDLLNRDEGAYLLDYMTVYPTNRTGHGFVTVNTRDQDTLNALFTQMRIGWANQTVNNYKYLKVEDPAVQTLVSAVTQAIIERTTSLPRGAISFADLFDGVDTSGGPVARAFRDIGKWWAAQTKLKVNDKAYEDGFRNLIELITFRQNIFMIAVAAQVVAPNGITVEAEKHGLATVYRDSYTGNYFVRSFKWVK